MKQKSFIELIGWLGMTLILLAYILVSFSLIEARGVTYQLLSGSGSLGIIIHSLQKKDYQPLVLNIVWVLVACFVLISLLIGK